MYFKCFLYHIVPSCDILPCEFLLVFLNRLYHINCVISRVFISSEHIKYSLIMIQLSLATFSSCLHHIYYSIWLNCT